MDLSYKAIHDVVHATAAFAGHADDSSDDDVYLYNGTKPITSGDDVGLISDEHLAWTLSQLNPKNRIDSLQPIANPLWLIDAAAQFGTQYFASPVFLTCRPPPMHLGIFIDEGVTYPRDLRQLLDLDQAFHIKDRDRLLRLGIASHIQRILQHHTTHRDGQLHPNVVKDLYWQGPFASMIIIENLTSHVKNSRLKIYRNHSVESELKSYSELKFMWGLTDGEIKTPLPPELDIASLGLIQQVHDSISVVQIYPERCCDNDNDKENDGKTASSSHHNKESKNIHHWPKQGSDILVLKSVSSPTKYLYHEMRAILRDIPPHEGILSRPIHIVTKRCVFGRKAGVIGFTMPFYPQGSLRNVLPLLRIHGALTFDVQLRWCHQITSVLQHMWTRGNSFYYPDLHLDNVILSGYSPTGDIGLVDFEQRGAWCSSSTPEVDYIESLRVLASDDQEYEYANSEQVCCEYQQQLIDCHDAAAVVDPPPPQPAHSSCKRHAIVRLQELNTYSNPWNGYNVTWNCLTKCEKEAAMVYMLGRLMWCICEGMSAPHRGAIWQSYPREPEVEFPIFRQTPGAMREFILKCFGDTGAREQSQFVRQGSKLFIKEPLYATDGDGRGCGIDRNRKGETYRPEYRLSKKNIALKARDFWHRRLAQGNSWLRQRNEQLRMRGDKEANKKESVQYAHVPLVEISAHGRPTLRQVLKWLAELNSKRLFDVENGS
ncbi:hypothetical protein SEPCBS57363_005200 [Sporothrix epigloea]|uniref:Protein kinase domain-containing protein n=1 Tax=Sporothrix epigloea TaxID=1892477 RepID=A0ABP0DYG7_9PEZI